MRFEFSLNFSLFDWITALICSDLIGCDLSSGDSGAALAQRPGMAQDFRTVLLRIHGSHTQQYGRQTEPLSRLELYLGGDVVYVSMVAKVGLRPEFTHCSLTNRIVFSISDR